MVTTREDKNIDIRNILLETHKFKSVIFCWMKTDLDMLELELKINQLKMDKNEIVLEFDQQYVFFLQQMISGSGKMNFYLPEVAMAFVANYKYLDEKARKLTISLPINHTLYDRRDSKRTKLPDTLWLSFEVKGKVIRKKCIDISEGGTSIVFSKMENIPSISKDSLLKMTLSSDEKQLDIDGKVVESLKLSPFFLEDFPYGGVRLSISFADKNEQLKKFLGA